MQEFVRRIPDGDNRERLVCPDCGHVAYENPKIVVGAVVAVGEQVLLCRRAIEPRYGFWTLPAGYLELGETIQEGAMREAWEEAQARISLDGIIGIYSISRIDQVQILFRARFQGQGAPDFAAGPESLEVALFSWEHIPWERLAFPTVRWALEAWRNCGTDILGQPSGNPAEDRRGVRRIEPRAPTLPLGGL